MTPLEKAAVGAIDALPSYVGTWEGSPDFPATPWEADYVDCGTTDFREVVSAALRAAGDEIIEVDGNKHVRFTPQRIRLPPRPPERRDRYSSGSGIDGRWCAETENEIRRRREA